MQVLHVPNAQPKVCASVHLCTLLLKYRPLFRLFNHKLGWFNGDILCTVVGLVDANKVIRQLKHVVSQADDNKLCMPANMLYVRFHSQNW